MTDGTEEIDCIIREASLSDMTAVAQVFRLCRETALPFLPSLHTPEEDLEFFSNVVFPKNYLFVAIACDTKRICGFIAFSNDFVDHLYVHPESQGLGLESRLLNVAKKQSVSLKLWTFQKNLMARKFYSEQGFIQIEETDGTGNEEKEPDVLLEWRSNTTTASFL